MNNAEKSFYQQQEMTAHKECDRLQAQLAERDKLLEQREATILEQQARIGELGVALCAMVAYGEERHCGLRIADVAVDRKDNLSALESALKAERIKTLGEVIAEWEKPYGLTDGSRFEVRLRRMAAELKEGKCPL